MDDRHFDQLTRLAAAGSRRGFLLGVATALIAALTRSPTANARTQGTLALGGTCASGEECQPVPGPGGPMTTVCADNGFTSDGPLNCCLGGGSCCSSDADCCGDLRCFRWPDVCYSCQMPPFPTRSMGEPCVIDADCIPYPPNESRPRCVGGVCATPANPTPEPRSLSDTESAMLAAVRLSELEADGQFGALYDQMHPDAQQVIPGEAVVGWYEQEFAPHGAEVAEAVKVRIVPWTWGVTGQTYPATAEVAYRQQFADGSDVRSEVRLVKDGDGTWSWFFGRDRAFVEEQIARFTGTPSGDTGAQPQEECRSTEDCSQVGGLSECVRVLGDDGVMVIICLRDTGGTCGSDDDCLRTMTCNSGTCGSPLAGEVRTTTQDLEVHADPPQRDLPQSGDDSYPPDEGPLLVIPAGSTVILAPGGSVWGYTEVEYQGTTGWVLEEFLIA